MNLVYAAQYIALEAHAGTLNKHDGELYLLHVARVVSNVKSNEGHTDRLGLEILK